jgi:DNA topoisomerase-3
MAGSESGTIAVLAEKPSVARDIARELGATSRGDGYLHGNRYVVTWAVGHLVSLAQPHEINPEWRHWRRDLLPIVPKHWPLVVYEKTKDQFEVVERILNSPRVARVVCATDAGREGELIFRYIYESAQCRKPFSRLWISSLTPEAIRKGFAALRPGADYDSLADAARGRSRADWLVGMNLSRAYSLAYNEEISVGRVQTPTLAMVVERELAIRRFVPEDYLEIVADFRPSGECRTGGAQQKIYRGMWFRARSGESADRESLQKAMRLPTDGEEAKRILERAHTGKAAIDSIQSETQRLAPPLFYDLTELQRHANRLYGFSAQKTLDVAQALYETYKLISYPRTDSRHLSQDVALTLPQTVKSIEAPYREHLAPGTGERILGRRFIDDSKVTDHHAIIPTAISLGNARLSADEGKIYDLICRRLLSAWQDDHIWSVTTVITTITNGDIIDRYHASGTAVQQAGWKVLDIAVKKQAKPGPGGGEEERGEQVLPPDLAKGQPQEVIAVEALKKKTRPPKRHTEGTLLTAMETAGKTLDEEELANAMKDTGLGTPATRAAIIEVLLKRDYIVRQGKTLEATDKGIRLIEVVHPEVKSPAMTGQWEAYLKRIQRGEAQLGPFLKGIEDYVTVVVDKVGRAVDPNELRSPGASPPAAKAPVEVVAANPPSLHRSPEASVRGPLPTGDLQGLLQSAFGFSSFRPNQEAVCRAAIEGRDVLLVMPTGSGKSLCYQLPGVVRGGTTLVISPLIALMEDQVGKLKEQGFAVDRIHSGRPRAESRQACLDYLSGKTQFLFIAPERLRVAGFPDMLAKRPLSLIAIDEAHCISQWGHDFRPDYRMLGQYLPRFRPAPVIALTATATPIVQNDIAEQLGLVKPDRFVHGFRRANIAIEVVEIAPSQRAELTGQLLREAERRPAIVYTPTRKQAESLAAELAAYFPAAAYHAGIDAGRRQQVQEKFQEGRIQVMVATIAFGMGIDKADVRTVIHTALPGSPEAYYQEIGRAGRDGAPSRAILMHSYADRYTHDFFFERDYPDVTVLESIFTQLRAEPHEKSFLMPKLRMDEEVFDKALEKLWTHGGAVVDFAENVSRGHDQWRESYVAQGEQKRAQIDQMMRYAESNQCRMATLVRHFGDLADGEKPCGICDFCAPGQCAAQRFRTATEAEHKALLRVVAALRSGGAKSTGKLYGELCPNKEMSRDAFEEVLGATARAGLLQLADAVFQKDGKQIPYRKASLTRTGYTVDERTPIEFVMKDTVPPSGKRKRKKTPTVSAGRKRASKPETAAEPRSMAKAKGSAADMDIRLEAALRGWRLVEARRRGVPAFRIFSDRTLRALATSHPVTTQELLAVPGIGTSIVTKYGTKICRVLRENGG